MVTVGLDSPSIIRSPTILYEDHEKLNQKLRKRSIVDVLAEMD